MHIFIDESGRFANPGKRDESLSIVGALCVADTRLEELYEKFAKLKESWGAGKGEIKGAMLNETQVRDALILLRKHEAKAKFVMVDLGIQKEAEIRVQQERQAASLTKTLTDKHHPLLVAQVKDLRERILNLSVPLYIQMILLTDLVNRALQTFTLWHATRDGRELGHFHWVVDPKDIERTEYEKIWELFVLPALEDKSRNIPFGVLEDGGDYSAIARFTITRDKRPEWWPATKEAADAPFIALDTRLILMEDFQYLQSKDNLGLQLADIVVSNLRRALIGRLERRGWEFLAGLTICETAGTINLIVLGPSREKITVRTSYSKLLQWFTHCSSSMLPPRFHKK